MRKERKLLPPPAWSRCLRPFPHPQKNFAPIIRFSSLFDTSPQAASSSWAECRIHSSDSVRTPPACWRHRKGTPEECVAEPPEGGTPNHLLSQSSCGTG